ncbi:MAG: hypothetical protein KJ626_10240 [Verrucomicrobia bacterium]|nr:hypothetical protein [Verrucomicrobiota bacterium]
MPYEPHAATAMLIATATLSLMILASGCEPLGGSNDSAVSVAASSNAVPSPVEVNVSASPNESDDLNVQVNIYIVDGQYGDLLELTPAEAGKLIDAGHTLEMVQ